MQFKKIISIIICAIAAVSLLYKLFVKENNQLPKSVVNTGVQKNDARIPADISVLTDEKAVVSYVKQHHCLPDCYITKKEAREQGWNPAQGNICNVLPGRAIGGDRFSNREHSLPDAPGRKWFEADINFDCGRRNADRLLFSSDGLVYVTKDHYRTFQQQ